MKITVTNDKQSLHNQGEFTAAIHGHIMLIKHRISSNRFTFRTLCNLTWQCRLQKTTTKKATNYKSNYN